MEYTSSLENERHNKTLDLVYAAIGAALIAVCSWIVIPTTVPFTLQTFAIFLVLLVLGGDRGLMSTFIYVAMGAVGLPVFAGFKGGIGVLFGSTGGYIIGFIFTGLIYAMLTRLLGEKLIIKAASLIIGLAFCYAFGTAWFMYIYTRDTGAIGVFGVLSWCVFPFVIPDLIKLAAAFAVSKRVIRVIR